jgi:rubrerythrin
MQHGTKPKDMKLFPRNLTARADYVVRGNPVVSRPESGADNSHPGLEFDQRNLDRGFFPGLLFDFQFGVGARLVDVQSPWPEKATEKDSKHSFDAKAGEFFLWYVYGRFGDQPDALTFADLYGLDGYEVLRKVHDLEPGPLVIVVGLPPEKLKLENRAAWLEAAMLLKDKAKLLKDDTLGQQIETFRDEAGSLQFAILSGHRARYLNDEGVIDLQTAEPGALTRSLCSPWQWDFADCGCYYWAASRPDIVTGAKGTPGLNFLRVAREEVPLPASPGVTWGDWMDPSRVMSQPKMILDWETLPLVIGDQEADTYKPKPVVPIGDPWDCNRVIKELQKLAGVEHALCVKFLYAYFSLNAPDDAPESPLCRVAKDILNIAVDEMRHFRWVNESLVLLDQRPVFSRATKLSDPPGSGGLRQQQIDLVLEGLTPESLDRFIAIEMPSQQYRQGDVSGLYTHILVSLDQLPGGYTNKEGEDVREQIQEVVKLIIDEGNDHWARAKRARELLQGLDPDDYLRFKGAPTAQPPASEYGALQSLGDHYYWLVLEVLRRAFDQPPDARGEMLKQARRVMHNLDEVGKLLGRHGQGLLFTLPRSPEEAPSDGGGSPVLGTAIPNLLAGLRKSVTDEVADLARRHGQAANELLYLLGEAAGGDDP